MCKWSPASHRISVVKQLIKNSLRLCEEFCTARFFFGTPLFESSAGAAARAALPQEFYLSTGNTVNFTSTSTFRKYCTRPYFPAQAIPSLGVTGFPQQMGYLAGEVLLYY